MLGGEVDDRGQNGADDDPEELIPVEERHADQRRLRLVVEGRPQDGDELDHEEQVPPAPCSPPPASLVHECASPAAVFRRRAVARRRIGAGDGNRTHDTQLGKLMFYH